MTARPDLPQPEAADSAQSPPRSSSHVSVIIGATVLLSLAGWLLLGRDDGLLIQTAPLAARRTAGGSEAAEREGREREAMIEWRRHVQARLRQAEKSSARLAQLDAEQRVPRQQPDPPVVERDGLRLQLSGRQTLIAAGRPTIAEPDIDTAVVPAEGVRDDTALPPSRDGLARTDIATSDTRGLRTTDMRATAARASPRPMVGTEPVASTSSIAADMLLLEVTVDGRVIADTLVAYQSADDILLPLGELSSLLTIAITTDPADGTASGFILTPERTFSLDVATSTAWLGGSAEEVDPQQVDLHSDDIYVSSRLLSRWLPVDLEVNMSRLSLAVRPREELPLQFRLAREARAEKLAPAGGAPKPRYPRHDIPYRGFRAPFIDQTLSIDYQGGGARDDYSGKYSAYATGDLLGMQGALYVNASSGKEDTDVRLTLGRTDPDAQLLGPLHARTALFGSVPLAGVENISRTSSRGEGVMISNRPLSQPTGFGQHSLQGPLPPGWDVELYYNDMLIGFQTAGEDGQYHFVDQPLVFGANEFRLVFHGPLGQVRVETETYLLEQSLTAAGEFYYQVAHQRDEEGVGRNLAQFDWGLNDHLAVGGGIVSAPVAGKIRHFTNLGLQAHWRALILSSNLVKSTDGTLAEMALRTRLGKWAISASRAQLSNFTSELFLPSSDPVRSDTRLRVDGGVAPSSAWRLPVSIEVNHEQRASGARKLGLAGRVSAHVRGTSLTGQLRWQSLAGRELSDATLQVSRRVRGISLRSQFNYALAPERRLTAVALSADRRLREGYLQTFGVTRVLDSSETLYSAGLTKSMGSVGYGVNAGYSSTGAFNIGFRIFLAMGRDPRRNEWLFDAQPMASTGAVSALVFLDDNLNGRMDSNEQPIEGVAFNVNGGKHPVETDEYGVAHLVRMPVMQHSDIEIVTASLDDPQWVSRTTARQLTPRPGVVAELEFPVISTSEIEGTVYVAGAGVRRGVGSLRVELVDGSGRVVATASTAQDGYYVFAKVPPGIYQAKIAAQSLEKSGFEVGSPVRITASPSEWLLSGVDIELRKAR